MSVFIAFVVGLFIGAILAVVNFGGSNDQRWN